MELIQVKRLWSAAFALLASAGLLVAYFIVDPVSLNSAPAGQLPYRLSKCFGLGAGTMLGLQVISGCANAYKGRSVWPWGRRGHIVMFVIFATLLCGHISAFLLAGYLRTGAVPLHLLLPDFGQSYYFRSIAVGALAFYLMIFVALAGARRSRTKPISARLHRLSYVVLAFGLYHSLSIGSESRSVVFLVGSFGVLLVLCVFLIAGTRSEISTGNPN